ncbi:unnamed protein product [Oikopleura dioica]|uniref:Uncharacterized protein n=1 Tax=Oikopleura dioica TaxID=34765 RepID=E4Z1H6_OIKDI|nr:unnamed protein product [Oikopleura dioica]
MSMLRRTSGSLTKTVRQITQQQPVKDNALRTTALGSAKVALQNIGSSMPKVHDANDPQITNLQITSATLAGKVTMVLLSGKCLLVKKN